MLGLLLMFACGDKDTALDPTHDADIQPIWEASCGVGCHTGGSASGDLALDDGYAATVGVESTVAGVKLVEPGDLDNSYLWLKIDGTHEDIGGEGSSMPLGERLSDPDEALVRAWILDGAPQ